MKRKEKIRGKQNKSRSIKESKKENRRWGSFKILTNNARWGSKFMSSPNREILAGVLFNCAITLNSLCWMILRNSVTSSIDISLLLKLFPSSTIFPTEAWSFAVRPVFYLSPISAFAFPLSFDPPIAAESNWAC